MKNSYKVLVGVVIIILAFIRLCNDGSNSHSGSNEYFVYTKQYKSFVGTYVVDLTLSQKGTRITTIVLNPDGTGYFKERDSYESISWWPADNGGGIQFSGGGADEQRCYYMNKRQTLMYWGLNDYMNNRNGYKVKRINSDD